MQLLKSSTSDKPAKSKEISSGFINAMNKVNSSINDLDVALMKECVEDDNITAYELRKGFLKAYKDPDRDGAIEWNDIWKHIKAGRDGINFTGFPNAGAYR